MKPYNLDTSFLIDVLAGSDPARGTMDRITESDRPVGVTPVAAAELWVGAHLGGPDERHNADALLDSLLWLDLTRDVSAIAGRLQARLRDEGAPLAFTDCLIAGATLVHGGIVVTRDEDFDRIEDVETISY